MNKENEKITILGVDPGYQRIGLAILEKTKNGDVLKFSTCIETSADIDHDKRLLKLGIETSDVIKKYKPQIFSIEGLFFNKNVKTALQVAEARGVLLFQASLASLEVEEYSPLQIKMSVTGNGRSGKQEIIKMVECLVNCPKNIKFDDEYDAIAIALTASSHYRYNRI